MTLACAYVKVNTNPDGTALVVRTNSAGGICVRYKGYPREYGYLLYPIEVYHGLLCPGVILGKHFVDYRNIRVERNGNT